MPRMISLGSGTHYFIGMLWEWTSDLFFRVLVVFGQGGRAARWELAQMGQMGGHCSMTAAAQ